MGDAQTPIAGMSLLEAKRSFLFQIQQLDQFKWRLGQYKVSELAEVEIDRLYQELTVRFRNLDTTMERIEELGG